MSPAKTDLSVAVVGGGWSGCASAVLLAAGGAKVTLFESARSLGGRARAVEIGGKTLDNGQHILLGAYRDTLRLLKRVGVDHKRAFLRLPLQMRYPPGQDGMDFVAPRLPAPLHVLAGLLRAKGLDREDKLALARFTTSARWMDWQLNVDCSVSALLERFDQTERLVRLMWRPLCLAALNTPPESASARVFLAVLRDSLGARRAASDMLLPRLELGALFPTAASEYLVNAGGEVRCGALVTQVAQRDDDRWQVATASGQQSFDAVVVATPPWQASALLKQLPGTEQLTGQLDAFDYEPIATCYLQYAPDVRLDLPFFALVDDPAAGTWGQFVFDRGQLDADMAGMLAVVVSAAGAAAQLGREQLAMLVAQQLAAAFGRPELASPLWTQLIVEKRATFACTPGLARPGGATGLPGLVLAGDYTASDYPATLESAARSGGAAAAAILAYTRLPRKKRSLSQPDGDGSAPPVQ
jgi:squalene-associated FAD-dependent desaturase